MALDVTANWIGNWPSLDEVRARLLGPAGLVPITLFGVFVLVTALPMLRLDEDGRGEARSVARQVDVGAPGNEVNPGVHFVLTW